MRFVDSHLHLGGPDSTEVVRFAAASGALLLACGVDERTSEQVLTLGRSSPGVVMAFVGVHPSEAERAEGTEWLEAAAKEASGIGEVGLDPSYSSIEEGGAQMAAFRRMLEVAEATGKPVEIHSRGAEGRCLDVLGGHRMKRVLMHWLQSEEALPKAMDKGCFVSFGPALLYSKKLQRMAARADPSLTLLESDSPVTYPPLGRVGGPALVPSVGLKLAELAGERFEDALARCNMNSLRFLGEKG